MLKYEDIINFPDVNLPEGNHLKGWKENSTNQTYNETFVVKKNSCFSPIIVSYIKYYSNKKLITEKEYIVNSSFILLEKENLIGNKILYWMDKKTQDKYYYGKEYIITKDLELIAVFEENKKNHAVKAVIIIVVVLFVFIGALLVYRYIRKKQSNKIEIMPHDSPLTPVN